MKAWGGLGVAGTIYEEEYECFSSTSLSDISSPLSLGGSRAEAWSVAAEREPDVLINVQGTSFQLHKDPLSKRSGYLRRHLTDAVELTLSPPLNITAETFSLVTDFCYGTHISVTPFNVVPLRVASELLQLTDGDGGDGGESLKQITESYFRRYISADWECATAVLRSCLALLPESETTAFLVGRCFEALGLTEKIDGVIPDVVALRAEEFGIVTESVRRRFSCHDLLYKLVDAYLKEHAGDITEENKLKLCNSIDCRELSESDLLHAVQNPRMPLRFVVRAIIAEQTNTRRRVVSSAGRTSQTLGSILRRESAARQSAQIRAAMDATSWRIESLERQLGDMKKLLLTKRTKASDQVGSRIVDGSARSASFHCVGSRGKVERGERGSVSSLSLRFAKEAGVSSSSAESSGESPKVIKSVTQKLIKGLKNTFRMHKQGFKKNVARNKVEEDKKVRDGYTHANGDFVWLKDDGDDDGDDLFPCKTNSVSLM